MSNTPFLPRRHSVRLQAFDYSQPCVCLLTVCVHDGRTLFGKVEEGRVSLNPLGHIVDSCWRSLPEHFPTVELSEHVVMPNHVHGIIILRPSAITDTQRRKAQTLATHGETPANDLRRIRRGGPLRLDGSLSANDTHKFGPLVPGSISTIVRSFKSVAASRIRKHLGKPQFVVWQRGFYERIIWNEKGFRDAVEYIRLNPAQWEVDENNPARRS